MADRDAFDLFALLGSLNRRDHTAYDRLTPDGQRAASPLVIMRWLSGTADRAQLVRLNEAVNRYVFALGQEKALLFKLMAAACTGSKRTQWLKGPTAKADRLALAAVRGRYGCSTREAEGHLTALEPADVLACAEDLGWDKDQLKRLKAELEPKGGGR